jgi:DNA repair exonuclease SbcCD ATPase subunit
VLERNLKNQYVNLNRIDGTKELIYSDYHKPTPKYNKIYFTALSKILSLPSEDILRSSFVIHEHHLQTDTDKQLRSMLTGTEESDYEDVLSSLQNEYYSITKERLPWQTQGGPRTVREIERTEDKIKTLDDELETLKAYFAGKQKLLKKQQEAELKKNKLLKKISLLQELLANLRNLERISHDLKEASLRKTELLQQKDQLEKLLRARDDLNQKIEHRYSSFSKFNPVDTESEVSAYLTFLEQLKQKEIQRAGYLKTKTNLENRLAVLPDFSEAPGNLLFILDELNNLMRQRENHKEAEKRVSSRISNLERQLKKHVVAVSGTALVLALSIASFVFLKINIVAGTIISAILLCFTILVIALKVLPLQKKHKAMIRGINKIKRIIKQNDERRLRINNRFEPFIEDSPLAAREKFITYQNVAQRIRQAELLITNCDEDVSRLRNSSKFQEYDRKYQLLTTQFGERLNDEIKSYRNLMQQVDNLNVKIKSAPAIQNLHEKLNQAMQEIASLQFKKEKIMKRHKSFWKINSPEKFEALIKKFEGDLAKVNREMVQVESKITEYRVSMEHEKKFEYNPEQILSEQEELLGKLEWLRLRKNALTLAMQVLDESVRDFRNAFLEKLRNGITGYLAKIIQPLSYKIEIDNDFHLNLKYGRIPLGLDLLSSGAFDQLFFAYRLTLADMLMPQINFPFIIDDAFVHFDTERRNRVFALLDALKQNHQFIICSSDERIKAYCDYTVELDSNGLFDDRL